VFPLEARASSILGGIDCPTSTSVATAMAKGGGDQLPPTVYEAALRAGRTGDRLHREKAARPVAVPSSLAVHEKENFGQPLGRFVH
jgi:hypothetical protein